MLRTLNKLTFFLFAVCSTTLVAQELNIAADTATFDCTSDSYVANPAYDSGQNYFGSYDNSGSCYSAPSCDNSWGNNQSWSNYSYDNSNYGYTNYDNSYGYNNWNTYSTDCFDPCCTSFDPCCEDYCCGPLTKGSFGIQISGGWVPINNTKQGKVWLTVPALGPFAVFSVSRVAQFRNQFQNPWIISGLATYNLTCNVQLFSESNYRHAKGKNFYFTAGTFNVEEVTTNFRSWAWYVGARYFLDRLFCDRVSPFVGFKTGLVRTRQIKYDLYLGGTFIQTSPYWYGSCGVSGGFQLGADWKLTEHLGAVLTLEVVATQGLKSIKNNPLNPLQTGGLTNVNIGEGGIQMSYPITIGARYTF